MSTSNELIPNPTELALLVWRDRFRVGVLAGSIFCLTLVYAVLKPSVWQASQSLTIREPATADRSVRGKFLHSDDRKAVQATIVALAHQAEVISKALAALHAEQQRKRKAPTPQEIAETRRNIEVTPPNGAEYGKTELFFLKVKDNNPEHAARLAAAVSREVQIRYQQMRDAQAQDMTQELTAALEGAQESLAAKSDELATFEASLGEDLAELRMLDSQSATVSDVRQTLISLHAEVRGAEQTGRSLAALLAVLQLAQQDEKQILATPTELLQLQPSLKKLKDGVLDAQLKLAQLQGAKTAQHPDVLAAVNSVHATTQALRAEIKTAIQGVRVDQQLAQTKLDSLKKQVAGVNQRLTRLAGQRTKYAQLASAVKRETEYLDRTNQELLEARAASHAAEHSRLLQCLGSPELGDRPLGAGKTTLAAGGLLAGLIFGAGTSLLLQGVCNPLLGLSLVQEPASIPAQVGGDTHWEVVTVTNSQAISIRLALTPSVTGVQESARNELAPVATLTKRDPLRAATATATPASALPMVHRRPTCPPVLMVGSFSSELAQGNHA